MCKLLILCVLTFILSVESTENVGTVLFTKADTLKKCWSDDELLLLRSRFIFQNLLPRSNIVCPDNEGFLEALISYFRLVISNVKASATGKNQEILLEAVSDTLANGHFEIPMPFFDSKNSPHAIAVPFKAYSLRSIESKGSVFVLVKYYMTATKCLEAKKAKPEDVFKFNRDYKKFLEDNVMPKLSDDKLYPAFGSVFRIIESINKALAGPDTKAKPGSMEETISAKQTSNTSIWNIFGASKFDPAAFILLLLAFVTFLWLLIGIIYYCCRMRRRPTVATVKKKKSKKKLCPMLE